MASKSSAFLRKKFELGLRLLLNKIVMDMGIECPAERLSQYRRAFFNTLKSYNIDLSQRDQVITLVQGVRPIGLRKLIKIKLKGSKDCHKLQTNTKGFLRLLAQEVRQAAKMGMTQAQTTGMQPGHDQRYGKPAKR